MTPASAGGTQPCECVTFYMSVKSFSYSARVTIGNFAKLESAGKIMDEWKKENQAQTFVPSLRALKKIHLGEIHRSF